MRQIDEEADRMLNDDCSLSSREFIQLLESPHCGGAGYLAWTYIFKYIFLALCVALSVAVTHVILKEYGYFVRCPGSEECESCYGPVLGKSWCRNPYYL